MGDLPRSETWAKTLDGIFQQDYARVVFEKSENNGKPMIYVDASKNADRYEYIGFYISLDDLKEIVKAMEEE